MLTTRKIIVLAISLLGLFACQKVDKLGDSATLSDFKIISHSPSEIVLGEPYIKADTVYIPVLRGAALFPMSISAEPIADSDVKQVLTGTSFSSFSDILLQTDDIIPPTFYLISKSGIAHPIYIKLEVGPQNMEGEIKQFDIKNHTGENTLIPPKAYINFTSKHITINSLNCQFPISISAAATLSENAILKTSEAGSLNNQALNLTFNSIADTVVYVVEAENGKLEKWKACINIAKPLAGDEPSAIKSAISVSSSNLLALSETNGFNISETRVYADDGRILFNIKPGADFSELKIHAAVDFPDNTYMLGLANGEPVSFSNYNDSHRFYLLDNRNGYYKEWTYGITASSLNDINKFSFAYNDTHSSGQEIVLEADADIDNIGRTITLYATKINPSYFPLTITPAELQIEDGATSNIDNSISFASMEGVYNFTVSGNGKDFDWKIVLKESPTIRTEAEIENFSLSSASQSALQTLEIDVDIKVNSEKAEVTIDLLYVMDKTILPLEIGPEITLSEGAIFTDFVENSNLTFNSVQEEKTITVQAQNGTKKQWKVRLINKPQLPNSNLDLWVGLPFVPNIDQRPGAGKGWHTANVLTIVKGTLPVDNLPYGKAAKISTGIMASTKKNLITSGTLFLGKFIVDMNGLDKPRKMTHFGIPFEACPTHLELDAKYEPGAQLQQSTGDNAPYTLVNLPGEDEGEVWIELLSWSGSGNIEYHAEESDPNITVLARGKYVFKGASDWNKITIEIEKTAHFDPSKVTHIAMAMASSRNGHYFIGAKGSTLTVDNIKLVY